MRRFKKHLPFRYCWVIIKKTMEETEISVRRASADGAGKIKSIHKRWVDFPTGAKALFTDFCIVLQLAVLACLYAFLSFVSKIFFYVSLALTLLSAIHALIFERDPQAKFSWLVLFAVSFGCGYIVYFLADKRICYGFKRRRYSKIFARSEGCIGKFSVNGNSATVLCDCEYIRDKGGYIPYDGTDLKYFHDAAPLFTEMVADLEKAEHFIFMEYFIVSEGRLLEKLIEVLSRKAAEGVEVRFLCDDVGSQGVLRGETKKRIKSAGIKFKVFAKLLTLFSFGLNFRDHRKIVVIDGKYGYVGGCNIADDCINYRKAQGARWKDAGLRLEGAAVDGLSLCFLRQWEFAAREKTDFAKYLNNYVKTPNVSNVVPYGGGPEIKEALCRGVYENVIKGAQEKLYIMTPYLIPDGKLFKMLKEKAQNGVDVRIALPAVPDYPFIYLVTRSNADRLQKCGVKIFYAKNTFLHSKVTLTENSLTVGSVNMDMRSFYQEFDNGVYTDDKVAMNAAEADFNEIFAANPERPPEKRNIFVKFATAVLRVVSPLM